MNDIKILDLELLKAMIEHDSPYKVGSKNDLAFAVGVEAALLAIQEELIKNHDFEEAT